jgi:hypothetical protein
MDIVPCLVTYFINVPGLSLASFYHFQVKLNEKTSLLETAESKMAQLAAKVNEQQKLIQKLEDDILKVWIYDFRKSLN